MKEITIYNQLKKIIPTISVEGVDQKAAMKEQKEYMDNAKSFVSRLSINRYFERPLLKFTQEEKMDLVKALFDKGFFLQSVMFPLFQPNIPVEIGLDIFQGIVKAHGHTETVSIGKCIILHQIVGKGDLEDVSLSNYYDFFQSSTVEFLEANFNQFTLGSALLMFNLADSSMPVGDQPFLQSIVSANKALFAKDLVSLNIQKLEKGETKLYDISYLF